MKILMPICTSRGDGVIGLSKELIDLAGTIENYEQGEAENVAGEEVDVYQGWIRVGPSVALEMGFIGPVSTASTYKVNFKAPFTSTPYVLINAVGTWKIDLGVIKFYIPKWAHLTSWSKDYFKFMFFMNGARYIVYVALGNVPYKVRWWR